MIEAGSPTVRRIQLGRELRRLRERAGVGREAAAAALECDLSKISRLESGGRALQPLELRALLALYGASDAEAEHALRLGREARRRSSIRVPDWFRSFVGLEAEAADIKTYESELVPGLLQTEDYTRAIRWAVNPTGDRKETERIVQGRLERQVLLRGDSPPQLWMVLNEAVIRRMVGGPEVMHAQLRQILELSELPCLSLQVMPFSTGAHAAMTGSFVILRLADPDVEVVYLEDPWSADYLDRPAHVEAYVVLFDRLCTTALDVAGSRAMIEKAAGEMR